MIQLQAYEVARQFMNAFPTEFLQITKDVAAKIASPLVVVDYLNLLMFMPTPSFDFQFMNFLAPMFEPTKFKLLDNNSTNINSIIRVQK